MTMADRYDVMAPTRQYTDNQGNTKTAWLKCGSLWMRDGKPNGIALECVPTVSVDREGNVGPWDGRLQVFEPRQQERGQSSGQRRGGQDTAPPKGGEFDDEIPF